MVHRVVGRNEMRETRGREGWRGSEKEENWIKEGKLLRERGREKDQEDSRERKGVEGEREEVREGVRNKDFRGGRGNGKGCWMMEEREG